MIPNPLTKSDHRTALTLRAASSGIPVASVHAADGFWHFWDGSRYVDTRVRIAYDVWNHVQVALNPATRSYSLVVQPVGEVPTLASKARWGDGATIGDELVFAICPSDTPNHITCYDNVRIVRGRP